jgi:hypothetical protein
MLDVRRLIKVYVRRLIVEYHFLVRDKWCYSIISLADVYKSMDVVPRRTLFIGINYFLSTRHQFIGYFLFSHLKNNRFFIILKELSHELDWAFDDINGLRLSLRIFKAINIFLPVNASLHWLNIAYFCL